MTGSSVIHQMVRRITVFVASPKDVVDQRRIVPAVINRVNKGALNRGILLDPWLSDVDAIPGVGRPQPQINPHLDAAAVVVLILWNRLGTPTDKADSGTVEEFERAFEHFRDTGWPRILVYYCSRTPDLKTKDEKEQWKRVLQFKEKYQKDVLHASFDTPEDFESRLEADLRKLVDDIAAVPLYRKIVYVKVTYLSEMGTANPFYVREVKRLKGGDRNVPVYDEAVYYALEMFYQRKKPSLRTFRSTGVIDPGMVDPLKIPFVRPHHWEGAVIKDMVEIIVDEECDTLLTVSHAENGLQGNQTEFSCLLPEDADDARLIVDFSSVPEADKFIEPRAAYLSTRSGQNDQQKIVEFAKSIFVVSCERPKEADMLKMEFDFHWNRLARWDCGTPS